MTWADISTALLIISAVTMTFMGARLSYWRSRAEVERQTGWRYLNAARETRRYARRLEVALWRTTRRHTQTPDLPLFREEQRSASNYVETDLF